MVMLGGKRGRWGKWGKRGTTGASGRNQFAVPECMHARILPYESKSTTKEYLAKTMIIIPCIEI